jgi:toxin YoeB
LLDEVLQTPFIGTGKPEPLKYGYEECWSRRITEEHRLVYIVQDDTLTVLQCRFHYDA